MHGPGALAPSCLQRYSVNSCLHAPFRSLILFGISLTAVADTGPLTVDALVAEVWLNNPGVEARGYAYEASLARVGSAGALDDPILSYAVAPESFGVAGLDEGHIVGIAQPLPWPGKRAARREAAESLADASGESLEQFRRDLAFRVRSVFADWSFLHQALAANRAQQQLLLDLLQTSNSLYSSGAGGQQAVLAAQLRRAQRQREALALQAELVGIRAQINALRAAPVAADLPIPAALPQAAALPPPERLQGALRAHPQVTALDARIRAAEANMLLARLESWPDLRLTATYLGTLPREENRTQVGLALNLPFGQARRAANRALEEARRAELRAQRRDALAQLDAALQHTLAAARTATDTARLYADELLPLAQQNLRAARAEYSAGEGSMREVIEAENELLEARLGAERARRDEYQQHARIAWMTGDAWEPNTVSENQP